MQKDISIIIWGCNDFSAQLFKQLKTSHVNVIGFIEKSIKSTFCDKPVYIPHEFKKQIDLSKIPIVVASPHLMKNEIPIIDFESIYQFKLKIQEIINEHDLENHLLHSSALIDFVHVEYPNKVIPFGPPGSGIVLFAHLCSTIIEKHSTRFKTKNKTALFFEQMCYEYAQVINQIIPDLISMSDGFNFHMSSWKIGTSAAICPFKEDQISIHSFSTRNHVIGPVYNYHCIPSEAYLNNLSNQQYKLFFNIRNPLDIILSCINKSDGIDKNKKTIDMKIFSYMSKALIDLLTLWHPISPYLTKFSYDNLIQNPLVEIKSLMNKLGIFFSSRMAKKIWNQLAFKQLPTAPNHHFWSGGTDKWEFFFNKEHLSFLKAFGIEEILVKYNYPVTLKKFKAHTAGVSQDLWKDSCSEELLAEISKPLTIIHGKEHDDTYHFLNNQYGKDYCISTDTCYITGKNILLIEKLV